MLEIDAVLLIRFEVGRDILKIDGSFCFNYFNFKKSFCNDSCFFLFISASFHQANMFELLVILLVAGIYWQPC